MNYGLPCDPAASRRKPFAGEVRSEIISALKVLTKRHENLQDGIFVIQLNVTVIVPIVAFVVPDAIVPPVTRK